MKYYPSYLKKPTIDYSYSNDNRTVQNSFESGRISQRSLSTTQRDIINVIFQFNLFQLGIFESFVQTTLSNGALEFEIPLIDPITQSVTSSVVLLSEGKYKVNAASGSLVWKVNATLIKQDKTAHSQELLDFLESIDGDYEAFLTYSDRFHTFVNETLYEIQ